MTLATIDDLESRMNRNFTDGEVAQVAALLEDVSSAVKIRTGQPHERDDLTLTTRVKHGYVRLPQRPVHSITAVTDIDAEELDFTWDGIDRVYLGATTAWDVVPYRYFGCHPEVVVVTYNAGPDEVPLAIVGVVCSITARAFGVDPSEGSVTQESIDGYSYTIGAAGGARAYGVLPGEAEVLAAFTRPFGNIQVAM